jgi:hypothetical protein
MKKTALLALVMVVASSPSMARTHHHRIHRQRLDHSVYGEKSASSHAHITCDMVRAYVAQVGLVQARAMALSAGMTASEERRAKRCLENKI